MTENRELLEALKSLAAEGPSEAPARVEERLKWEFRRRHHRRNLLKWVPTFSAAAAAAIAVLLWMHSAKPKPTPENTSAIARSAAVADETSEASFYPLPEAEALPEMENAMVVRVQMPVSSLQLMGVPIGEDRADASVQAELLLGQDGLARGVRLVE